jgi:hypothetical protein
LEALVDQMSLLRQTISGLLEQQKSMADSKILEAKTNNNIVNSVEIPDENEKFINEIQIKFYEGGKDSIFPNYEQIFSVASQCPYKGGKSVYRARHFVNLFNDTIEYDDESVCSQVGIFRKGSKNEENLSFAFKIIPNPANETATVILEGDYSGICEVDITDVTNRNIISKNFNCEEKAYKLNTKNYPSGIYMVHILLNGKYKETLKLVIAR